MLSIPSLQENTIYALGLCFDYIDDDDYYDQYYHYHIILTNIISKVQRILQ